jgi:hypothetical protein
MKGIRQVLQMLLFFFFFFFNMHLPYVFHFTYLDMSLPPFKKGQMVWLDSRHLKTNYYKKMAPKREGPFEIEEVLALVTYQLKLPESW